MPDWMKLKEKYRSGRGFKRDDILEPIEPLSGSAAVQVQYCGESKQCIVLEQCPVIPHMYDVLATADDGETFTKFEINGYEWRKVGHV